VREITTAKSVSTIATRRLVLKIWMYVAPTIPPTTM
jgi:hypothetical protein